MGMLNFFNTPEHKVFTFKPRYYDPEKEKIEQARARMRMEENIDGTEASAAEKREYKPGEYIRGSFSRPFFEQKKSDTSTKGLRGVIWVFSLLLAILIVYLLFDKFMPLLSK